MTVDARVGPEDEILSYGTLPSRFETPKFYPPVDSSRSKSASSDSIRALCLTHNAFNG